MKQILLGSFFLIMMIVNTQASNLYHRGAQGIDSSLEPVLGPTGCLLYPVVSGATGTVQYYIDSERPYEFSDTPQATYDPMQQDIAENAGLRNYVDNEKLLILSAEHDGDHDYQKYNKLVFKNDTPLSQLAGENLSMIREIDFSDVMYTNEFEGYFKEFVKNKTLVSLNKINFGTIEVPISTIALLKELTFGDECIIRKTEYLDRKYKAAVAPIYVIISPAHLKNLRNHDHENLIALLEPVKPYIPIIYLDNINQERLARLKVFVQAAQ